MADTCCPLGYVYVDSTGTYSDPSLGTFTVTNYNGTTVISPILTKCIRAQTVNAFGAPLDPNPCPCCPTGMTFSSYTQTCFDPNSAIVYATIPCIPCVCVTPPPPPPCVGCQEGNGIHVSFSFNDRVKQCINCVPDGSIPISDPKLNCFAPYFILVPAINFTLD